MSVLKNGGIRCFVAIEIPESVRDLLVPVQMYLQSAIRKASWTKSGNFHLTLKFLGDVCPESIDAVGSVVQKIADIRPGFSIVLGGIGAFPTFECSRVIWVGLKRGASAVSHVARALNVELKPLGFAVDNRFHPHLTLGRLRRPMDLRPLEQVLRKHDTIEGAAMHVSEITVMRSVLHRDGALYTSLRVCPFSTLRSSKILGVPAL